MRVNKARKKWSPAEKFLFATPLLFLLLFWLLKLNNVSRAHRVISNPSPIIATVTPITTPTTSSKVRQKRLINQVVPAPDGRTLWTLNRLDGKLAIHQYSVASKVWMRAIDNGVEIFSPALRISPNGRALVYGWSGNKGQYAEVFDAKTGKSRLRLAQGSATSSVAISPDSRFFAMGYEGYFDIRSLSTGQLVHRIHWQSGQKSGFLRDACFSHDGKFFAVSDGVIGIFSTQTWRSVASYCPPKSEVVVCAFAGQNLLVIRSQDKKQMNLKAAVWLYNFQSRKLRWLRALESSGGYELAVSPDEKFVAISDYLNSTKYPDGVIIEIFDVKVGTKMAAGQIDYDEFIPTIAFSANSQTLFVGGENARIRYWPKSHWNLDYPNPIE